MTKSASPARARLHRVVPALPVRSIAASAKYLGARFGFSTVFEDAGFAKVERDEAVVHLWLAHDESWRDRDAFSERPVCSGAESFLAGTASCRIDVDNAESLFHELQERGVLHQASEAGPTATDFGTREFATGDLDGNLIEFVQWLDAVR